MYMFFWLPMQQGIIDLRFALINLCMRFIKRLGVFRVHYQSNSLTPSYIYSNLINHSRLLQLYSYWIVVLDYLSCRFHIDSFYYAWVLLGVLKYLVVAHDLRCCVWLLLLALVWTVLCISCLAKLAWKVNSMALWEHGDLKVTSDSFEPKVALNGVKRLWVVGVHNSNGVVQFNN